MKTMWTWIGKGGALMYPIIFCSILAFAIFIERFYYLYKAKIVMDKFMVEVLNVLRRNRIMEALDMCDKVQSPMARILKAGIIKHDRTRSELRETIKDTAIHEVPVLEKNLSVLATIVHITPLLGLLGTVIGMVRTFQVIQEKSQALQPVNPGDLAGGIWQALLATAAGLCVAVPAYVAYNYLASRVDSFVSDMEKNAIDLVNVFTQRETITK
ncbi:MAG: biopolymer transporter ExbB [Candidatus Omnitrophica bacterium CG07_land_8_20_14_0_80_42_15]|uniref:Biopolymer transporter ExbB n=1 Tax=Candidatus Aquitaenariimonas noxiae TaxID=1974741 RepID=A0A2J0KRU8_9BACT|nr:MAG: biopolymer transporter ExbB [Candidatus Omnitrophica bacterium CG07_land_8_20_14_0_80_42_15]